jgi:hypothetical protein
MARRGFRVHQQDNLRSARTLDAWRPELLAYFDLHCGIDWPTPTVTPISGATTIDCVEDYRSR